MQSPSQDDSQATPLDILLNAIHGSSSDIDHAFHFDPSHVEHSQPLDLDGFIQSHEQAPDTHATKRSYDGGSTHDIRTVKRRTDADDVMAMSEVDVSTAANIRSRPSVIQLWHPRTGQKSYGKERRMLNPPPTLIVKGPLHPLLTCVTLATSIAPPSAAPLITGKTVFASQTYTFPLNPATEETDDLAPENMAGRSLSRRELRILQIRRTREQAGKSGFGGSLPWERERVISRDRQILTDGLAFPGLWVGDEIGKQKEFRLELHIAQPGVEHVLQQRKVRRPGERASKAETSRTSGQDPSSIAAAGSHGDGLGINHEDGPRDGLDHGLHGQGPNQSLLEGVQAHIAEETGNSASDLAGSTFEPGELPLSLPKTWATLPSRSLTVVSKPSQKTGRARSLASCLTEDDTFAFYLRINSQTVRTKYMKLELTPTGSQMVSRTGTWSPFKFEVIRRAVLWEGDKPRPAPPRNRTSGASPPETLTYGSIVTIVDEMTGIKSDPVKLVRVEKNEVIVGQDEGHPVSELHRVAFARHEEDAADISSEARTYLSAPGARAGGGELVTSPEDAEDAPATEDLSQHPITLGDVPTDVADGSIEEGKRTKTKGKRRTKRIALAEAAIVESNDPTAFSRLSWERATVDIKEVTLPKDRFSRKHKSNPQLDKVESLVDRVEDWMCWIIASVESSTYTIFDSTPESTGVPLNPIDPVPRLLSDPLLDIQSMTLDLLVSPAVPIGDIHVYLGSIGPLSISVWQSASVRDNGQIGNEIAAVRIDKTSTSGTIRGRKVATAWPAHVAHYLIVVELPPRADILRIARARDTEAHQSDLPIQEEGRAIDFTNKGQDSSWLSQSSPLTAGEMTIQEALRHAENALQNSLDMTSFGQQPILDHTFDPADQGDPAASLVLDGAAPLSSMHEAMLPEESKTYTPATYGVDRLDETYRRPWSEFLPILLTRRSDGVSFGLDKGLRIEKDGDDCALRVVNAEYLA